MDYENVVVVYLHNRVVSSHKEEWNPVIFRKMDRTRDHHVKQNKSDSERQVSHVFSHMQSLDP
jgi:hypothetical protein